MTEKNRMSEAEIRDRITQFVALGMFCLALVHAASIAAYFVTVDTGRLLGFLEKGLSVVTLLIMAGAFLLIIRKRMMGWRQPGGEPESFINDVARKAFSVSWALTLALVVGLDIGGGKYVAELPVGAVTDLIKLILLGTFSVSFLVLSMAPGMGEPEAGLGE